ncbi:MAG: hypothetical protein M3N98_15745 [Actinomycetota bacterium]|nr:hypothetical protein [Actinomycetota bacterium]
MSRTARLCGLPVQPSPTGSGSDEAKSLGAGSGPNRTLAEIAPTKLLAMDSPELVGVKLDSLLAG